MMPNYDDIAELCHGCLNLPILRAALRSSPVINAATSKMDMTKCIPSWRYMAAKRGQQFGGGTLGVIELPPRIGSK